MKIRHIQRRAGEVVQLPMTPMIDIVFLLLIFFIMTFKIVAPEGDFNIKMPLAAPSEGIPDPSLIPPIKIRLKAGPGGQLTSIGFGDWSLGTDFGQLRAKIRGIVGDEPGPTELENTEVEFDCDYNLRYEYVIEAITAVSGYIEGDHVIKTIEKIKFSPPRISQ